MMVQKTAILFGASGLIGGQLLQELLNDPAYGKIIAVVRRDIGVKHPKLNLLISDLQSLNKAKAELLGDDVFCCLGTTRKKTLNLAEYYQIDHDYPVSVAAITKEMGARTFIFVSAVSANPKSSNFYLRIKGETERDIQAIGFECLYFFRPSLLTGKRGEKRSLESLSAKIFGAINPLLIGPLKQYRSIPAASVAVAMNKAARRPLAGTHIYYWNTIKKLA